MAITNQDFMVKLHTFYGSNCLNVFWFRKTSAHTAADASGLLAGFNAQYANAIANVLNTNVTVGLLEAFNLVDMADYHTQESTPATGGIASSSPAPIFTSYSIRLNRSTRQGRHGYKRLTGVAEELVSFGSNTITGALVTPMAQLLSIFMTNVTNAGNQYQHMIPHRQRTTMPDGSIKYVLTDLLPIASVVFQGLTTQNTRKLPL